MGKKHFVGRVSLVLALLLLACCAAPPAEVEEPTSPPVVEPTSPPAEPTKPVPTDTPAPPAATPTPACALECDVGMENYSIVITCESGAMATKMLEDQTTSTEYDASGNMKSISLVLNQQRTYENTQNAYTIEGYIQVDFVKKKADYRITVTGGEFGDTPQTCRP